MQQFTVPQFIDVEDKIIGPITVRQFVIMLAWGTLSAVLYRMFDTSLFVTLSIILFVIFGIFAFFKVNGMPFHFFILNIGQTLKKPRIRIWNNQLSKTKIELEGIQFEEVKKDIKAPKKQSYSKSRLAELSLVVDTGGTYQGGDKQVELLKEEHARSKNNLL